MKRKYIVPDMKRYDVVLAGIIAASKDIGLHGDDNKADGDFEGLTQEKHETWDDDNYWE